MYLSSIASIAYACIVRVSEGLISSLISTSYHALCTQREYRIVKLANGIDCILISDDIHGDNNSNSSPHSNDEDDENVRPSAVALSVKVGYFADPFEVAGLAHFLEHMLFMGTKKYPGENEWEKFVSQHGGYSNASTDAEHTIYQFEINHKHLPEALDRFAQFFIAPLFHEGSSEREMKAVDSEFMVRVYACMDAWMSGGIDGWIHECIMYGMCVNGEKLLDRRGCEKGGEL